MEPHHMLAGGGITSKAGGLRGGGSLSSTALQLIMSRCKVGCEQSMSVSCGDNGHKRVMTVAAVGIADGMAAASGALNAMVTLTMMVTMIVIII